MFYYISQWLLDQSAGTSWSDVLSPLRLFRYITVRSAGAAITALLLSWWLGPRVIAWLKQLKFGQEYRDKAEETGDIKTRFLSKKGTPTMGGILIVMVLHITTVLWAQWTTLILLTLLSVLVLTALGFYDDYAKITQQTSGGATAAVKLIVQFGLAIFIGVYLWSVPGTKKLVTDIMIPFYKHPVLTGAGLVGIGVTVFAIVGSSNAVNLTDGLDGLAIMPTVLVGSALGIFAYVAGNAVFSKYLLLPYIPGAGELAVFCSALAGAGLGFLWFNAYPAEVFMGDVGALALGAALGTVAVIVRQEIVLFIMGGVFVAETLSVMLQVGYFKYTKKKYGQGRRILRMAPLHHHFEQSGWKETQVVVRFWIITILLVLFGLSTLKIR